MIKFNTVTWYSQIAAIVLGVTIFFVGMYVGARLERAQAGIEVPEQGSR